MRRHVKGKEAVSREVLPGVSTKLLQELHLVTRDGNLNADSLRKLKQVNHLIGLLRPAMEDVMARFGEPLVVDCGAGKGYLGFLLHDVFLRSAGADGAGKGKVLSVESRVELTKAAEERAKKLGMVRMEFVAAPLAEADATLPKRVHVVTALHACDTATDDAIAIAVHHDADWVALVPCCQAEVARQLEKADPPDAAFASLAEHPWHRREIGSHLTNVFRALALQAHGYKVTVTELAGWEHSLKNELILGKKVRASDSAARAKLDALLAATGVRPAVVVKLEKLAAAATT